MGTKITQSDIEYRDTNLKINLDVVKSSIQKRINRHLEKIVIAKQAIIDNINFPDIVNEQNENINARLAKIEEANEILEYCFEVK